MWRSFSSFTDTKAMPMSDSRLTKVTLPIAKNHLVDMTSINHIAYASAMAR
jgi:hypothetical protein